jgi:two-component system KDP operon response regulator KdpE
VVTYNGEEIQLTPTEYDLLTVMIQSAGRVLTHHQLLKEVRGAGFQAETHLLRVHMSNLRRKIEADPSNPQIILTEPGIGYRLKIDS